MSLAVAHVSFITACFTGKDMYMSLLQPSLILRVTAFTALGYVVSIPVRGMISLRSQMEPGYDEGVLGPFGTYDHHLDLTRIFSTR